MEPGASLLKHVLLLSCITSHLCHFKNSKLKKKTTNQCGYTHNPRALSLKSGGSLFKGLPGLRSETISKNGERKETEVNGQNPESSKGGRCCVEWCGCGKSFPPDFSSSFLLDCFSGPLSPQRGWHASRLVGAVDVCSADSCVPRGCGKNIRITRPSQEVTEGNYVHLDDTFMFAHVSWEPFIQW